MKKRQYMKPAMLAVEIQQSHIICGSYDGKNLRTHRNRGDEITDEDEEEIF